LGNLAHDAVVAISPKRVLWWLIAAVALLVAASIAGQVAKYFFGHDHVFGLVRVTYLNGEATIPAWFSSLLLAASAASLAVVGLLKRAGGDWRARYWLGLAALFVYMSADEAAGLHELWGQGIGDEGEIREGFFRYAWVIPGMVVVTAVAAVYARFVWELPAPTRRLFVIAGLLFVGSGLGFEMIAGYYLANGGATGTFGYSMIVTVEETGEMIALVIFLYAILEYLGRERGQVRFAAAEPRATRRPSRDTAAADRRPARTAARL
jgi:hypothetical protein